MKLGFVISNHELGFDFYFMLGLYSNFVFSLPHTSFLMNLDGPSICLPLVLPVKVNLPYSVLDLK